MINVSPYIERLNLLREYMELKINEKVGDVLEVNMTMYMAFHFGMIYYKSPMNMSERLRNQTFDEYCKFKQTINN